MKQSLPLSHVAEQVAEHLYNLSIPDQAEILNHNFGIDVEDIDEGVVWEGALITDSQFDQQFIDVIENMSTDSVLELWEMIMNTICHLDSKGNVVWTEEE